MVLPRHLASLRLSSTILIMLSTSSGRQQVLFPILLNASVPLSRSVCNVLGLIRSFRHTSWLSIHSSIFFSPCRRQRLSTRYTKYSNLAAIPPKVLSSKLMMFIVVNILVIHIFLVLLLFLLQIKAVKITLPWVCLYMSQADISLRIECKEIYEQPYLHDLFKLLQYMAQLVAL